MKKGFTLIELLAVIVILAIIALIATPIILGIINDAKKQSNERSVELYTKGLELAIVRMNLEHEFNPTSCTVTNGLATCIIGDEFYRIDVDVENANEINGTITFENTKVKEINLTVGEQEKTPEQPPQKSPQYYTLEDISIGDIDMPNDKTTDSSTLGYDIYGRFDWGIVNDGHQPEVTAIYACFRRNGQEYCLKGGDKEKNKEIMDEAFYDNPDACYYDNDGITYGCDDVEVGFSVYELDLEGNIAILSENDDLYFELTSQYFSN